jgi:hypothetical protein
VGSLPAFVAVAVFAPAIASAAETDFVPRVELTAGRQGNVTIVGQRPIPDSYMRVGLHLVFLANTERTSINFSYQPSRIYYRNFTELDFGEHRLSTTLDRSLSPASTVSINVHFYSGQGQGIDPDQPDEPVTLVPRTDRDSGKIELRKTTTTSELSTWDWGVGTSAVRYHNTLPTTLEDADSLTLQDADTLFADLGYDRDLSERISLGGVYDFQFFQYESERSDVEIHTFLAVANIVLGQYTEMRVGLGAFLAEGRLDSFSDPSGELILTRVVGERSSLSAAISQRVSVGTGLQRATRNRGGYLAWSVKISRDLSATINASFWRREDLASLVDQVSAGTRTFLTAGTLNWNPWPTLGVSVFHSYNNQDSLGSTDSALDTRYHSGGVTVRWSPRGR